MDDVPTQRVAADGSEIATVCVPLPPLEFDRYELLRELGRGGTGVVWMAHDRILGAQVALKTLRPEITSESSALRELKSEVLINRTLSHPHIVRTYDFVTSDRSSAISMEYVSGTNLHRLKSERPNGFFEADEIAAWIFQLCDAMEYAHRRNVVHRDLKPANLMIDEQGLLKVGDFGIGQTATEAATAVTRKSSGTPPFMSPQQTMGERAVPADDIYGIGATIYDLLTGDPPFFRGAIREQALAKVAPSMTERRKELGREGRPIPPAWEAAVAAALSKEASGRPPSAAAFRALLEGTMPASVTIRPPLCSAGAAARVAPLPPPAAKEPVPSRDPAAPAPRQRFGWLAADRSASKQPVPLSPAGPGGRAQRFGWLVAAGFAGATLTVFLVWRLHLLPAPVPPIPRGSSGGAIPVPSSAPPYRPGAPSPSVWSSPRRQVTSTPAPARPARIGQDLAAAGPAAAGPDIPATTSGPIEALLQRGQVTSDEAVLLRRALIGQQGDFEQALATRLAVRHSLTAPEWRAFSGLIPPATPIVAELRPLLMGGSIREAEFPYLADALAGRKGPEEAELAAQLVVSRDVTPGQWRSRTALYPPPPVDPIVAKLKPWLATNRLSAPEAAWIEAALRGQKSASEKALAESLIDQQQLTAFQWRARTAMEYPLAAFSAANWPPAIDLPLGPNVTLRLLRVDPGTYDRGTPATELGRRNNEPLPAAVRISAPFYLGVTEVTQAQFTALMPRNPSYWRGHPNWPVDQVDWRSLTGPDGFLERLNRRLARTGGVPLVADLPTSDEWEYACRAGTTGPFYAGSGIESLQHDSILDRLANYGRSDEGTPIDVGSLAPNAWGFYDLLGNVAEWCRGRIIRGGSWQSNAAGCRIGWQTESNGDADADPASTQGFRLLLRLPSGG